MRFNGINIGMSSGTSGNKDIVITTKEEENYIKELLGIGDIWFCNNTLFIYQNLPLWYSRSINPGKKLLIGCPA